MEQGALPKIMKGAGRLKLVICEQGEQKEQCKREKGAAENRKMERGATGILREQNKKLKVSWEQRKMKTEQ